MLRFDCHGGPAKLGGIRARREKTLQIMKTPVACRHDFARALDDTAAWVAANAPVAPNAGVIRVMAPAATSLTTFTDANGELALPSVTVPV